MAELKSQDILDKGDRVPDFDLQGTDGERYSLSDFEEYEAVLLVFICNHCPTSQSKFEELNRLTEEYDEVAVVGINPNDTANYPDDDFETMVENVEDGRIQWDAYLRDETQAIAAAYGAMCTPDPFLLKNTNGVFQLAYHGRLDDALMPDEKPTKREMKSHIDTLLADEEIDAEFNPSRGCSIKWREGNEPDYW